MAEPTVANTSSAYEVMRPRLALMNAVLGGTETMRTAGMLYKHPEETDTSYTNRLAAATLYNVTALTLNALVGRVFREEPEVTDAVPDDIRALFSDIDLQGTHIWNFAQRVFTEAMAKGFCGVMVDYQQFTTVEPVDRPRTLEDDRQANLRPYWITLSPENVLAAYGSLVNGRWQLSHVRLREEQIIQEGWEERTIQRVRVLTPDSWELWELQRGPRGGRERWNMIDSGVNTFGSIPILFFYTECVGLTEARPPLLDLAYLNVEHWNNSSDQRNILTTSRFPMLAVSGIAEENIANLKIGPNRWLITPDPQAKWYYVEPTGAAIQAGANSLDRLEAQMTQYGAEFLRERGVNEGTIGRVLDSSESTSTLAQYATMFGMYLGQLFALTARWMRMDASDVGFVRFKVDLTLGGTEASVLNTLTAARNNRDISRTGYLRQLTARKVLTPDFDPEVDAVLLAEEMSLELEGQDTPEGSEGSEDSEDTQQD